MKTLYIECRMGAAGDMLMAALSELIDDKEAFAEEMNAIGLEGVSLSFERASKCGIVGTHARVLVHGHEEHEHGHHHGHHEHHGHHGHHGHHHSHADMHGIEHIISGHLHIPDEVKRDALAVYELIAEAESFAHGAPVDEIHFHEVGTADAIADIVGVSMLMRRIAPDRIVVSPIHVGSGTVRCAHGILPVPAPATARILRGVPTYGGDIEGELCTPTGAAILRHFADDFGPAPMMSVERIGYGMGTKDFPAANCVRAMLGESGGADGYVCELSFTIDDMTAEALAFATERLFADGALEVYTIPINMKKSRQGALVCVMCDEEDRARVVESIFRHTTTIGLRETLSARRVLSRTIETVETELGPVRVKRSAGYGVTKRKGEHDDIARIARERGMTLDEVQDVLRRTF